ncbi:hypothetical protein PPYR_03668 [Photinus pyralis]|uniref:Uncharacterized protein n=1 Tax=Photinus pyralis TaxID=7054 RepID=A0A5N4A3K3_PHOPY|nr:glutathione S-transferase 1-like [Photinus pyralis]KAB0791868.1 hypothetical protein PPYR_03668 [Photinus pyralis]
MSTGHQRDPVLYVLYASPAVRSVLVTAKILNLKLDEREVDFLKGEHLKPEYLKLNPLHTMPTLNDNGNVINDSHAINTYLVGKYGQDDSLYPKGLYQRALVDQKLAFNLGKLYPILVSVDYAYMKGEIKAIPSEDIERIRTLYDFLEAFLENSDWISLGTFSLADIHCYTTISCMNFHVTLDEKIYPKSYGWMMRCRSLPCFSDDHERVKLFEDYFKSFQE